MLFILLSFLLCSFCSHVFFQNCFASLASDCRFVLVHSLYICWLNFLLFLGKVLFCLHCLTLFWYPLNLLSFAYIFWFISSSCIVRLICCLVFVFSLFLRVGNVFFSVMIFFINYKFILSSCVNIFVVLGVCGVLVFCILCFNSVRVTLAFQYLIFWFGLWHLVHILHYLLVHIFLVSQALKTNLSLISF